MTILISTVKTNYTERLEILNEEIEIKFSWLLLYSNLLKYCLCECQCIF